MFAVWVCESTFCPRNISDWRVETEADSIVGAAVLAVEAQFILCVSADAGRARDEGKGREKREGHGEGGMVAVARRLACLSLPFLVRCPDCEN
jgi:hypothetical protein